VLHEGTHPSARFVSSFFVAKVVGDERWIPVDAIVAKLYEMRLFILKPFK
jgi:hypothetical protein